jgi:N-acetyl sugar amidotransferase
MRLCSRCLYGSHHPLNITFDDAGVCSGCSVHEEKDRLDWSERAARLRTILDAYRNRSGNNYDCVVPVSGARDSYFIVHTLKNVYGMNPLLVTYNKHYNTDVGIRNLANLRIRFDCDILTLTVNPEVAKRITRATLRRLGSIYWHCLAGQTVFPVQVAVKFKIPLIVWGAHQGIDQVGMFSHLDEVEMTRKYRKEHDLMGLEAEDLICEFDGISEKDIVQYRYPDSREIEQVGVRGIYLSNYVRWDSRTQHEQMIHQYSYETAIQTKTFDTYNNVDCWNYSDVHDYIKFVKHGFGAATDHACREIRLGRMSREEGVALVQIYNLCQPKNLGIFLQWIGISENAFHYMIDQHRNPSLWRRNHNWEWEQSVDLHERVPRISVPREGPSAIGLHKEFFLTKTKTSPDPNDKYILFGKGYDS